MDENTNAPEEEMTDQATEEIMPPGPSDEDYEEWERRRREEEEAKLAPYRAIRSQINEHDELMADTLYELTLLELGEMEV